MVCPFVLGIYYSAQKIRRLITRVVKIRMAGLLAAYSHEPMRDALFGIIRYYKLQMVRGPEQILYRLGMY